MLRSRLALLMILLAAPADAESSFGGGFHGGGFHGARVLRFPPQRWSHPCFHWRLWRLWRLRRLRLRLRLRLRYDCEGYNYGYGYGYGSGYFYSNGPRNAVSSGGGLSGGYVPDPVGAEIPPVIFPTNCWVRRAAHDPSGAYFGQVLVDLCRPSDSVTVTGLKARAKAPDTGIGTDQPAPLYRSGAPQSPQ